MTLRSDLIPVVDSCRTLVSSLGLRLHTVQTVRRTWSGGAPGRGTATTVSTTLSPAPKVREPSTRATIDAPGRFEAGDRIASRISATYTRAQLDGGTVAAGAEWYWTIDGDPFRVVSIDEKPFGWTVHLRRMRDR